MWVSSRGVSGPQLLWSLGGLPSGPQPLVWSPWGCEDPVKRWRRRGRWRKAEEAWKGEKMGAWLPTCLWEMFFWGILIVSCFVVVLVFVFVEKVMCFLFFIIFFLLCFLFCFLFLIVLPGTVLPSSSSSSFSSSCFVRDRYSALVQVFIRVHAFLLSFLYFLSL